MNRPSRSLALATLVALGAAAAFANAGWQVTYLQNPRDPGSRTTLGPEAERLEDKHWLTVQFSEYAGFRPSLAVLAEAEPKQKDLPEATTEMGRMIRDIKQFLPDDEERPANEAFAPERMSPVVKPILRAALGSTHRFRVVDRDVALQAAISEQDFGTGGRVNKRSAVRLGNIRGASYGVRTQVVETNPAKDVKSITVGAGVLGTVGAALGGISVGGKVAFCRINVEVVDMETGDVVFDVMVDGTASEKTRDWAGGVGGLISRRLPIVGGVGAKSSAKEEAVLTDAIKVCASKAAHYIATRLEERPFMTSVARVSGPQLWVIGGSDLGLREGMLLRLLSRGEPIVDPASGDTVDVETKSIGQVRVLEVMEKSSRCEATEGGAEAKAGDYVRFEAARH